MSSNTHEGTQACADMDRYQMRGLHRYPYTALPQTQMCSQLQLHSCHREENIDISISRNKNRNRTDVNEIIESRTCMHKPCLYHHQELRVNGSAMRCVPSWGICKESAEATLEDSRVRFETRSVDSCTAALCRPYL